MCCACAFPLPTGARLVLLPISPKAPSDGARPTDMFSMHDNGFAACIYFLKKLKSSIVLNANALVVGDLGDHFEFSQTYHARLRPI